jgi:glucan phosphorylase
MKLLKIWRILTDDIRYQYGMFKQDIKNGWQVETPDYWLQKVSPWEIRRNDINYPVRFGGEVRTIVDSSSGFVRVSHIEHNVACLY